MTNPPPPAVLAAVASTLVGLERWLGLREAWALAARVRELRDDIALAVQRARRREERGG